MIMNKMKSMVTVRTLKDADFSDVNVEIDNYCGDRKDPILIDDLTTWERFKLRLDDFLLKRRRK